MNKIVVSVENHNCVFKIIKENDEEIIFYNTDYFTLIGFPDAEVIIGNTRDNNGLSETSSIKGGYYDKPDELTYPFRHLVYLIQGTGKRKQSQPIKKQSEYNGNKINNLPNFFNRLEIYGKEASNMLSSGIKQVKPYFTKKQTEQPAEVPPPPENKSFTNEPSTEVTPPPENKSFTNEPSTEVPPPPENKSFTTEPSTEVSPPPENNENIQYYKVIIPINAPTSKVPLGNYEKKELLLDYLLLENKIEKGLGKSCLGKIYKVGTRYIRMCEEVKEWSSLNAPPSALIGTKMHKFAKLGKN